jgi:RimJ/RimL family protein N-acetyltransferase
VARRGYRRLRRNVRRSRRHGIPAAVVGAWVVGGYLGGSERPHWEEHGFGQWVVELPGEASFIGVVGLETVSYDAHFTPAVEVAWRLVRAYWGRGYATEAAKAALDYGFGEVGLGEIVALTVPANQRSRRVMKRLGMTQSPQDDFDHPRLPEGPLRRHVLYRLRNPNGGADLLSGRRG